MQPNLTEKFDFVSLFIRLAAEKEVAAAAGRDCTRSAGTSAGMGRPRSHHHHPHNRPQEPEPPGPNSLFLFGTETFVRKYTKFIIEWPYPFETFFIDIIYIYIYDWTELICRLYSTTDINRLISWNYVIVNLAK